MYVTKWNTYQYQVCHVQLGERKWNDFCGFRCYYLAYLEISLIYLVVILDCKIQVMEKCFGNGNISSAGSLIDLMRIDITRNI